MEQASLNGDWMSEDTKDGLYQLPCHDKLSCRSVETDLTAAEQVQNSTMFQNIFANLYRREILGYEPKRIKSLATYRLPSNQSSFFFICLFLWLFVTVSIDDPVWLSRVVVFFHIPTSWQWDYFEIKRST